jgi:hypothetical protein
MGRIKEALAAMCRPHEEDGDEDAKDLVKDGVR